MSPSTRNTPSFFLIPDEKINYESSLQLGNVIYSVTEPEALLFQPASASPPLSLGVEPSVKELQNYRIAKEVAKSSKYGLFTKILDLFGFGANISHNGTKASSESYEVKSMRVSTFVPPPAFLSSLGKNAVVNDVLRNSSERFAYLVTGVVVATGVEFISSTSKENENEGSIGISSSGLSVGPSGSRSRKHKLDVSYSDAGPVVLAFKVQKLQLKEDGGVSAKPYVTGAYFSDGPKEYTIDFDADLDEDDITGMDSTAVLDETSGEECILYSFKDQ
jgi:hypothetical protein